MALGLHVLHTTKKVFLAQLSLFDSISLNKKGEFACWIEGSCNFYIVDDLHEQQELEAFAEKARALITYKSIPPLCTEN